jgi:hypothetical protein
MKQDDLFKFMGLDKIKFLKALKQVEDDFLKDRDYLVVEFLKTHVAPDGTTTHRIPLAEDKFHWFMKWPNGSIIDVNLDNLTNIDYTQSKPHKLRFPISRYCMKMAEILKLDD